jgi:hypothetical protein
MRRFPGDGGLGKGRPFGGLKSQVRPGPVQGVIQVPAHIRFAQLVVKA